MLTMWKLSMFILYIGVYSVMSVQEQGAKDTRPITDFIKEGPTSDYTLSLSKDWALKFDEEVGRGDYMTEDKQLQIHNDLLEVAEILHIIPEGSASRYSDLIIRESMGVGRQEHTTLANLDHDLSVSIPVLRRHGVTTFSDTGYHVHSSRDGHHNHDPVKAPTATHPQIEEDIIRSRKYSPRLAMYSKKDAHSNVGGVN